MSLCVCDVASWKHLQLNTSKSEVLWCSSVRRHHLIPDTPLIAGVEAVLPALSVRNLAIYIDSDVSMLIHVAKTASSCFCALRQIRSIRRTVSKPVLLSLVVPMVLSQLPLHTLGTIYHPVSLQRPLCLLSERNSNRTYFLALFWLFTCACMYYFTCLSFMLIFFLNACAAHIWCYCC